MLVCLPLQKKTHHLVVSIHSPRDLCAFVGQTLDQSELQGDGIALSLEEQLCALSLSESTESDPKATVSLNGSKFRLELFEKDQESTKVRSIRSFFVLFYNEWCVNTFQMF